MISTSLCPLPTPEQPDDALKQRGACSRPRTGWSEPEVLSAAPERDVGPKAGQWAAGLWLPACRITK